MQQAAVSVAEQTLGAHRGTIAECAAQPMTAAAATPEELPEELHYAAS
jgi:hypothetical protein